MERTKYEVARKLVVVQWTPSIVIEKIAEDKKEQKITTIIKISDETIHKTIEVA